MSVPNQGVPQRPVWTGPRVAALLATALVAGIAAGVLVGRGTVEQAPAAPGLAPSAVATILSDRIAAMNGGDGSAVAAFYAEAGVLEERDVVPAVVTEGRQAIANRVQLLQDFDLRLDSESAAIAFGRYAAEAVSWPGGGAILVYELDDDLKITHQWVIGGTP